MLSINFEQEESNCDLEKEEKKGKEARIPENRILHDERVDRMRLRELLLWGFEAVWDYGT